MPAVVMVPCFYNERCAARCKYACSYSWTNIVPPTEGLYKALWAPELLAVSSLCELDQIEHRDLLFAYCLLLFACTIRLQLLNYMSGRGGRAGRGGIIIVLPPHTRYLIPGCICSLCIMQGLHWTPGDQRRC